eukprot:g5266.t1
MSSPIRQVMPLLLAGTDLSAEQTQDVFGAVMDGAASDAEIAALLTALRIKGESIEEVVGSARAMGSRATPIPSSTRPLLDTCGTGGDELHTFNISTAAALVAASAGAPVAKHGNRSVSSSSGSADVLEALGVNIQLSPDEAGRCIDEVGIGFCFAQLVHGAMKHAAPVRKQLGFRTIFNLLGPLTNPAGAEYQLVGANTPQIAEKLAGALAQLGRTRAVVVCGNGELDEVALWGTTDAWLVDGETVTHERWSAESFGLPECAAADLTVDSAEASANVIREVFAGEAGAARNMVIANAATALYVAQKNDTLVEAAPAVCRDGLAIVISPLISLMKDQVDALTISGVPAACVNSSLSVAERHDVADRVRNGELRLLYMAPERLVTDRTIDFLKSSNVSFIAIDEAHCISEWGHDFRPEYRQLRMLKETFPDVALHAYTATATERVRADIVKNLALDDPEILVGSFDRPNLVYSVLQRSSAIEQIRTVIDRHPGESGIVYCIRRDDVDTTVAQLRSMGYRARPYHAGMSPEDRKRNQDEFISEATDIIVATVAFGMGIDKSNVRFVVHAAMPKSLENYQQESGRAGRDGLEAECVLLYSGGDASSWKRMQSDLEPEAYEAAMTSLNRMSSYCTGVICRHRSLVQHFGERYGKDNCGACDVCSGDLDLVDDAQTIGQKILSCVVRLDQRFGADYTSQVLAGSSDKRILERGHNNLSTWGLLKEEDRRNVRDWIEQLVGQNYLEKAGEYNILQVTTEGRELLRGEVAPRLLKPKKRKSTGRRTKSAVEADSWEGVDETLFNKLRELRRATAEERGVPAYVVFDDAALREMAREQPVTLEAFLEVKGVGEKRRDDYGEPFVACIAEHRREVKRNKPPTKSELEAFPLFEKGDSVELVAETLDRKESTVNGYLTRYLIHYQVTDYSPWVSAELGARIEAAAAEVGCATLKPIYEKLNGEVEYNAIRIVAECLQNREAKNA